MAAVDGANWACDISRDTSAEKHNGNDSIATQRAQAICYRLTAATQDEHIVTGGDKCDFQPRLEAVIVPKSLRSHEGEFWFLCVCVCECVCCGDSKQGGLR